MAHHEAPRRGASLVLGPREAGAHDETGTAAGLPEHVYTKATPSFVTRLLVGITGAAASEALFYTSIRKELDVGAPQGYYGAFDPRSARSLILMEDIAVTRGATFGNAAIHVDRPGAESMVREMASYHGAMWEDPRLRGDWSALRDALAFQEEFNAKARFDLGAKLGWRQAGDLIPSELQPRRSEMWPAAMRSLELAVAGPQTLLHQDTHPANWFRLPDGTLRLYDWQGVARGGWGVDFSYAISAALEVEDRRAWEGDLVALYVEELARAGGPSLSFDEAFLHYRQQMFHGLIFWLYTLAFVRVSELQPREHCRLIVGRTAQVVADLDSFGAVGAAG